MLTKCEYYAGTIKTHVMAKATSICVRLTLTSRLLSNLNLATIRQLITIKSCLWTS